MSRRDVVGGVGFGAAGLLIVRAALDLPLGSFHRPGPGFAPLGLGAALVALSLVTLVGGLRRRGVKDARPDLPSLARVLAVAGGLVFFAVALPWLGYLPTAFVLMWALFAVGSAAPLSWRPLAAALVVTGLSYLLFETLLGTGLPAGRLWGG